MIAIHQKVTLATAAFALLGIFGSVAFADQPGSGSGPVHMILPKGEITGTISFSKSLLPQGFNSKACRDFSVLAENGTGTIEGKSGKMSRTLKGHTALCSYSIEDLPAGSYTVVPKGHPHDYAGARCGGFDAPQGRPVTLKLRFGAVRSVSNVDFAYSAGTPNECAAPAP